VEPFEFTPNGGGGQTLSRFVKRHSLIFYEFINFEKYALLFKSKPGVTFRLNDTFIEGIKP